MSDTQSDYQVFVDAVGQLPAGMVRWWIEEVLIRGTPAGGIAGAHVIIGAELTDPLGGKTRSAKGPYPLDALSVLTGQPAADWQGVLGTVLVQQQAAIADRDKTIADMQALHDQATQGLQDQIGELSRQLAAALTVEPAPEAST